MSLMHDHGDLEEPLAPVELARERPVAVGDLVFEPALRRVVHADGREEFLEPRVMQVLVALLSADGRILTRDDLQARCWRGVVVGEDAITRALGRLRRLSETRGHNHFRIETITKVGYRLVRTAHPSTDETVHHLPVGPSHRRLHVCVLPFADLSLGEDQGYFSDGVSEDIITDLGRLSGLIVVARNLAFSMKGQPLDQARLATMQVTHVLEGSIRKAGSRLRISARLSVLASGDQCWAERWDRDLDDVFALQDEISDAVVRALRLTLLPEDPEASERRGTRSADAYNLYLQARAIYVGGNQGSRSRDEAIISLCRCAIEIDPDYARAWALMAIGWDWLIHTWGAPADEGWAAVARALALDPNLPEAHAVKAKLLNEEGQVAEAAEEIETALRLDPDCYEANETAGLLHYRQLRMSESARHYAKAATLMERDFGSAGMLLACHNNLGDAEATARAARMTRRRAEEALERDPHNGGALGFLVGALTLLDERDLAREWMSHGLRVDPDNRNMRYNFARALVDLRDFEDALDMLKPFFATTTRSFLNNAKMDPDFDPIRADPRFAAMVAGAETRLARETAASSLPAPGGVSTDS